MPMTSPTPRALLATLEDPYDRKLSDSILGSADAAVIHVALERFCRDHTGSTLTDVTYCTFSVGAGFGLALADRRHVFLKSWSPTVGLAMLDAVHLVQASLALGGFPAPRVLVRPAPFMAGHASVMEWAGRGVQMDAARPALRTAMASALARQVAMCELHVDLPGLPRHGYPAGGTWGPAHNALFDFEATAAGAGWIDEIATAAARVAGNGEGRVVLGHRDWRVQNMRFDGDAVSAVYDWDALTLAREPEIVGMAAAIYTATSDIPVERYLPPPEWMAEFIADYEHAAGRRFTDGEWRTAGAAATHLLAYIARCEHCYAAAAKADSAQGILRAHATVRAPDVLAGVR